MHSNKSVDNNDNIIARIIQKGFQSIQKDILMNNCRVKKGQKREQRVNVRGEKKERKKTSKANTPHHLTTLHISEITRARI